MNSAACWPRAAAPPRTGRPASTSRSPAARRSACWCPARSHRPAGCRAPGCRWTGCSAPSHGGALAATSRGKTPARPVESCSHGSRREIDAAELHDSQPPPLGAVLGIELLQQHDPVGDALHLEVPVGGGQIVEQHDRAVPAGEKLLERQNLPAMPPVSTIPKPASVWRGRGGSGRRRRARAPRRGWPCTAAPVAESTTTPPTSTSNGLERQVELGRGSPIGPVTKAPDTRCRPRRRRR